MTGRHRKGKRENRGSGPQRDPDAPRFRLTWVEGGETQSVTVFTALQVKDYRRDLDGRGITVAVEDM